MSSYRVRIVYPNSHVEVRNISVADYLENNVVIPQNSASGIAGSNTIDWADYVGHVSQSIVRDTGSAILNTFPNTSFYFTIANNTSLNPYPIMRSAGYTNGFVVSSASIGTKIVFNNGNYIEIYNFTDGKYVYLRYCLANGTVCAQTTRLGMVSDNTVIQTVNIPWYSGNPNNFGFIFINTSCYSTGFTGNIEYHRNWHYSQQLMTAWLNGLKTIDLDDPYIDIEDSTPSGKPTPSGLPTNDAINIPSLPTVSVADTGFVTLFNPSLSQIQDLADYMWGSFFDVSTFKKIFADPMDCILGFNLLPVAIPNGSSSSVVVGNISTGVQMTKASTQWVELDCGSLTIGTPYDNYLDFSPYTKYSIYLPYIGTVELSADDCVDKTLHLVYHVDVLSCACVAYLKCGDSVLYQFTGSCGYSIPLTSENFRSMIGHIVSIAGTVAGAIASGGMSAPLAVGAVANTANNVMGLKPEIHRSGAIGSSAGIMGIQKPYLILEFPNPCKPEQQYKYTGYPSFVTVKVGDLSGYTEFDSIILDGVTCDEDEKALIEEILKGGVYL